MNESTKWVANISKVGIPIKWLLIAASRCNSESISAKYASVSADVARMFSSNSSVHNRARHGSVLYTMRGSVEDNEPER